MTEKEKMIDMILQDEDIKRYKRMETLINSQKKLKGKLNELKSVQKQLVNAKHIGKKEAISAFQTRYDLLYQSIEEYPLMSDYMALQSDINEMIQSIVSILEEGLEKDL